MRRDKVLAETILRTLVLDDGWTMSAANLIIKLKEKASDAAILYHLRLLEDIGLIEFIQGNVIRVTSAGQDRAENADNPNAMATWSALSS